MRPTDDMSSVLNVEREIIVLFASYDTFEMRTLLAFDKFSEQFDDVRIDRSLRILISNDKNIEATIRHYLLQDPEYPIVIPFAYSDFRASTEDFIFSAIRRNFLIRDLFGYQSPLRQEYYYFGRRALIEHVIDLHKAGQNSSLFGLRKSGKTSTIYAIQRRAKAAQCRTILIDCQDPAIHARNYAELLTWIVVEARRELGAKSKSIVLGHSPAEVSDNFRTAMRETLNTAGSNILLLFDEIEHISPRTAASSHWRDGSETILFWQILRAFYQSPQKMRATILLCWH